MSGRKVILLGPLPPPYGGVSVFMASLVEHLRGGDAHVWALHGEGQSDDPRVSFLNHRRFEVLRALPREGRGARVVDLTHFHLEYPNKFLLPPWLALKRALGFEWYKYVLDGSLPERHRGFRPASLALFRAAVGAVDEFVVVSEELRRWLKNEIGVSQRVTVVPCLLPIPERTLDAALSAANESKLAPYLRRRRRVCSVGVFIPSYGFGHVAAAVERLRAETGEDVGLALLDGTFARDEAYRTGVLGGREWITVLENVPNREVYQVLKRSDAFVRGFGQESYGISRVEALWCGLPVVATTVGETRGMLAYDFGDEEALLRQLRRALFEPDFPSVARWADTFRKEAEANLRNFVGAVGLS